jgi:nucleotide-binding universal stress UspA family protein
MKTILVPVDLSRATSRVCDAACSLAQAIRGRLVLLHVVQPPPVELNSYGFAVADVRGMLAVLEKRAARKLLALGRRCEKSGRPVRAVQLTGKPVPAILAQAKVLKAEFIVLGSHGHNAAYDLLVGSTAQGILRQSRRPVLVVPMPRVRR